MMRMPDFSALGSPVTKEEIAAYRAELARTRPDASAGTVIGVVIVGVFIAFMGLMLMAIVVPAVVAISRTGGTGGVAIGLIPVLVMGLVAAGIALLVRSNSMKKWERWVRLDRFARANGLVFSPRDANPNYPGAIFNLGRARQADEHLRSASDRFLDFGNYRYTTGSGKSSRTHHWGFMALQLDRTLPHMVLDSKANNGLFGGSNLPATFSKDQVLSLEGDFDQYFTLYCPKQYERDALYVFTPDLMALCIDHAAPFDIEIIDRWMFVYSSMPFDMANPAVYHRLFRIVDTVGAKTLTQTDRYRDERVANFSANVVAPQGARLKRGVPIMAIVVGVLVLGVWVLPQVIGGILAVSGR